MSLLAISIIASLLAQGGVTVDAAKKEVRVPCKIAPRKLPNLPEVYPIEVVATLPAPKGQKAHETVVVFDAAPSEVHKALESLGLKPGKPGRGEVLGTGPEFEVLLDLPAAGKTPARQIPIESALVEKRTGKPLPRVKWRFTGSALKEGKFGADVSGTLIALYPVTDEVVLQSGLTMREEGMIKLDTAKNVLPPEGTAATLVLRVASGAPVPPAAAAAPDPEKQVLKLSRSVGPAPLAAPVVAPGPAPASAGSADPFEHRREVRPGKGLADSIRPADLPAPK